MKCSSSLVCLLVSVVSQRDQGSCKDLWTLSVLGQLHMGKRRRDPAIHRKGRIAKDAASRPLCLGPLARWPLSPRKSCELSVF